MTLLQMLVNKSVLNIIRTSWAPITTPYSYLAKVFITMRARTHMVTATLDFLALVNIVSHEFQRVYGIQGHLTHASTIVVPSLNN